jgi:hypothetical protein
LAKPWRTDAADVFREKVFNQQNPWHIAIAGLRQGAGNTATIARFIKDKTRQDLLKISTKKITQKLGIHTEKEKPFELELSEPENLHIYSVFTAILGAS